MKNGEWYLGAKIEISGLNNLQEYYEFFDEVKIPLPANVKDVLEAEKQAQDVIADIAQAIKAEDREHLKKYYNDIDWEDEVVFSNFHLAYHKEFDVGPLCIVGGP